MIDDFKAAALQTPKTLAGDFVGAVALMVTLVGGLYLPGLM
ncbi:MAG: hypothetical protein AAFQ04_13050 [Pseudomonadota bacterium]